MTPPAKGKIILLTNFNTHRNGNLLSLVERLSEEHWDMFGNPVVDEKSVVSMAQSRLRLILFVFDLQFAQGQNGRNKLWANSLICEKLTEVIGRWLVIGFETLLKISDNQANVGRIRQNSVRKKTVKMLQLNKNILCQTCPNGLHKIGIRRVFYSDNAAQ